MAVLQWWDRLNVLPELPRSAPLVVRESARRRQLVSTILWARLFLGEGNLRSRLLGAVVMLIGGVLVAA